MALPHLPVLQSELELVSLLLTEEQGAKTFDFLFLLGSWEIRILEEKAIEKQLLVEVVGMEMGFLHCLPSFH